MPKITPHLWFDTQAEEAANFYCSIFPNSKIGSVSHYPESAEAVSGMKAGTVMTIEFELDGNKFLGLNGGPLFKFSEAVSFVIPCETQEEIDHYWDALSEGGDPAAQQCGWLKDKYGLSWQIVPTRLGELIGKNPEKVTAAFLQMKKFDIQALEDAAK